MGFIKFVLGTIGSIVAFIIAVKVLAIVLALVGFALKLIWLAVVIGFFALIAWLIYKLVSPRRAEQV